MPQPTKTLNPLHFEDLEPHRFEDIIRQLIYDLRQWKSIEATGRTGSDEGMDIRAIERLPSSDVIYEDETEDSEPTPVRDIEAQDRLWIIQCKRERQIGPTKIRNIVSSNLSELTEKPYGYMLVAACDFSKAARDAFRDEVVKHSVEEFVIWGKAEVEDQLYLPKNDHLLFAYFNISLQVRRRSLKTETRARLTLKRKLTKELGEISNPKYASVLIRNPRDEFYPFIESPDEFIKSPRWRYWEFHAHQPPDHLAFIFKKYFAYVNWKTKEYDVLKDFDAGVPFHPEISGLNRDWHDPNGVSSKYRNYWLSIPEENQAWAMELRIIHYDRILAFDDIGDSYNQGPHLLVEYGANNDPFEPNRGAFLLMSTSRYRHSTITVSDGKRISYFPSEIPEEK